MKPVHSNPNRIYWEPDSSPVLDGIYRTLCLSLQPTSKSAGGVFLVLGSTRTAPMNGSGILPDAPQPKFGRAVQFRRLPQKQFEETEGL
jgi:hypothetical protein